jgi:hypothetical protein
LRVAKWRASISDAPLTRRRDLEAADECWHVYFGDVRVDTIAERIGIQARAIHL